MQHRSPGSSPMTMRRRLSAELEARVTLRIIQARGPPSAAESALASTNSKVVVCRSTASLSSPRANDRDNPMRYLFWVAMAIVGLTQLASTASAQSTDPVLERLNRLEKENAALRDRMQRLERTDELPPITRLEKENAALRDRMQRLERTDELRPIPSSRPNPAVRDEVDFDAEQTRFYPGDTKERVIRAAEAVLRHSDPGKFEFTRRFDGITGIRRFSVHVIGDMRPGTAEDKWEFSVDDPAPGRIRAVVSVSRSGMPTTVYSADPIESPNVSVALYQLFWNRVQYVLGERPDWISCERNLVELSKKGVNSLAVSGLCGPTSAGKNDPPPVQLPRERAWGDR